MNVSQLMNRTVETCGPDESLAEAAARMWNRDIGCLAVVDDEGAVIGMVTDRDLCMAALMEGRALHEIPVARAMSKEVHCCAPSDSLIAAEEQMRSQQVRRLPVLDADSRLVGMVSLNDLAREAERHVGRKGRAVSAEEITVTLAAVSRARQVKDLAIPLTGA
jgi:CBS domain-containing protein